MKPGKPKMLKINNRRMVLDLFRHYDLISIPEISAKTSLSKTVVGKNVEYFLSDGLLLSAGKGESTNEGGKRPNLYQLNSEMGLAVGIQIHHLRLYSVLTNLKSNILHTVIMNLADDEALESILQKISTATRGLFSESGRSFAKLLGIGIGFPAITNFRDGVIRTSPWFPSWGVDIVPETSLKNALGQDVSIILDNECRFQVLAERELGVARNRENIVSVYIGAGTVAGIMVNDELKRGVHNLAGEIGHMVVNPFGKEICNCGGRGCFESMVYEHRLLKKALDLASEYPASLIFENNNPGVISMEDIFSAANSGDELATKLLDEVIGWFAIAFSNITMMVDPEIIVIQGIYAKAGNYFIENLRERVNGLVLPKIKKEVEIKYSKYGPEACALGAALFIISDYFKMKNLEKQESKIHRS